MSYLAQYVSEVKEGHTITADDVAVLARVQQALLAADKHHQQARDAQANVAEKLVVNAAVALVDLLDHHESHSITDVANVMTETDIQIENCIALLQQLIRVGDNDDLDNLRIAVAHLLAVEAAS